MLFNSREFLIFFPIVVLLYFVIPKKIRYLWLLAASYYFYMCWNARYALLILTSTGVTYLSGLLIDRIRSSETEDHTRYRRMKWVVAVSFLLNLSILFFFKYFNFTCDLVVSVLGLFSISFTPPVLDVLLPVGISFYTFQALSYTMDVYRGDIGAEKNFFRYALFVSFFPQLVAGPIERSSNLLKQLAKPASFKLKHAGEGLLLMVWGFFLKLVIADRAGILVDHVYNRLAEQNGWALLLASVLFAFQIYCDFSGYSVIAMGTAKVLGIDLMENFRAPYLADSVSSFWRNWHISLTSWFKDYLYIPLGGSRKGTCRKYCNKLIVFLVSGLWHGADMSFVIWGGLNGIYQILEEMLKPLKDKLLRPNPTGISKILRRVLGALITFVLVDLTWIFFRAPDMTGAVQVIRTIFSDLSFSALSAVSASSLGLDSTNILLLLFSLLLLGAADIMKLMGIRVRDLFMDCYWKWLAAMLIGIFAVLVFGVWGSGYDASNFIYFQF
ncbi:MAG: MBOAT family protein [Lachnospiraceae bacterium]|nr:MBOAT family protein [Lachnospiraceae bacterium]